MDTLIAIGSSAAYLYSLYAMINVFRGITKKDKGKLLKELEASTLLFKKNTSLLKSVNISNMIGIVEKGSSQILRTDYNGNITIQKEVSL